MRKALKDCKFHFVLTKPNAGDGVYEQGEAQIAGALNVGEPQAIGQEMMGVLEEVLPHPDNNQVNAYAQLLATVEELKEVVGE